MSKYSVKEVRAVAKAIAARGSHFSPVAAKMLAAYANLKEQIERAREGISKDTALAIIEKFTNIQINTFMSPAEAMQLALQSVLPVAHLLPSGERDATDFSGTSFVCYLIDNHEGEMVAEESLHGWIADFLKNPCYCTHPPAQADADVFAYGAPDGRVIPKGTRDTAIRDGGASKSSTDIYTIPLYAHPPAQAAQVEDWRAGMFERWREAAQEKGYAGIAEAITAAPAAEPMARGEAVAFKHPAAVRSAAKFLLERFENARCDSDGVSCCIRCSAVAMSRWAIDALDSNHAEWRPMDTAPRDGSMLRLLVQFEDHATEDTTEPAPTIGAYSEGAECWQFAGWCWSHDHFTEGKGEPVGWLPMLGAAPSPGEPKSCDRNCDCIGPCKMGGE